MSTFFQKLTDHPLTEVVGWTLIHFLWQGLLLAALAGMLLAALRGAHASTRYLVAFGGLALMALAPSLTSMWLTLSLQDAKAVPVAGANERPAASQAALAPLPNSQKPVLEIPSDNEPEKSATGLQHESTSSVALNPEAVWAKWLHRSCPYFVALWSCGVLLLSLRLLCGLWRVRQWRQSAVAVKSIELKQMAARLASLMGLSRRFELLESARATVPAVIGWVKPAVIVPASLIAGLTPAELESLLAHELAHIRRHDYLMNLLQTVIETMLFYHPAVWWLSGVVRCERENCCDDMAVTACGSRTVFVRALAKMEELRCGHPELALSARGGSLVARVQRLVLPSAARPSSRWPAALVGLASMVAVICGICLPAINDLVHPNTASAKEPKEVSGFLALNRAASVQADHLESGRVLATHTYDMSHRESTGWIEVNGVGVPVDQGVEAAGVKVYVSMMLDVLAVDVATGKVLWHHDWGKQNPTWQKVSIIELESNIPVDDRLVAELVSADGKARRRYNLKSGKEITDAASAKVDELVRVVRREGDRVTLAEMKSRREGRFPLDLLQKNLDVLMRPGMPTQGTWIADQETLVSAENASMLPIEPQATIGGLDAGEVLFNLPEGSGVRAEFAGENIEITTHELQTTVVVTNGRIKLFDSNGVVRAEASPDGAAEQLVVNVSSVAEEGVLRMQTRRIKPNPDFPQPPVQVKFNFVTGAPAEEQQPPHGAVRYAFENPTKNEPARLKIRWHYDLQRIVEDAERESGKTPEELRKDPAALLPPEAIPYQTMEIEPEQVSEFPKSSTEPTDLVSEARKLGDWWERGPRFRFDSAGYMRLAAELKSLDESRRVEALREMANAKLEGQTIALCRMMFEAKSGGDFRRPKLGGPSFIGTSMEMKDWPLEPITLVGEVPLWIVDGYLLGGYPEPAIDYLEYCLANCDWTKRSFSEIEKAVAAADQTIRQPAFWGGSIDEEEWREWARLRQQLQPSLAIQVKQQPWVNTVIPLYMDSLSGRGSVKEIIERAQASGIPTDAPVTLVISDNAKPEWIKRLVHQLAEAGYRNQEHIWWQQSHEPVEKPELQKFLLIRSAPLGKVNDDWGSADPKTGLRLRLTLAESSVPAGKPVLGKLELHNSGKQAAKYDPQTYFPFRVVQIAEENGKPAQFIGARPQTFSSPIELAPGESVTLWENVDLSELYLLDSGNYEVTVVVNDRHQNLILGSASARLKVDGGQLAPNLQLLKQLRAIAPADWGVSTGFGAIYLSHSPTNLKQDVTTIQLWFTDEPLPVDYKLGAGDNQQQVTTIAPTELGFLHLAAPARANELWPEHVLLIKTAAARVLNFNSKPAVEGENETDKENSSKRPAQ